MARRPCCVLTTGQMTLLFLAVEFIAISAILLGAVRLGIAATVTTVSALQFMQSILGASFFWSAGDLVVSPGSCVLFASNLAVLVYIYGVQGAAAARTLFHAIVGANLVVILVGSIMAAHIAVAPPLATTDLPARVFSASLLPALVGVVVLAGSLLLGLTIYTQLGKLGLPPIVSMTAALVFALVFDTLGYLVPLFWNDPNLGEMLKSGVISKGAGGLAFGLVWGGLLQFRDNLADDSLQELFLQLAFLDEGGLRTKLLGSFKLSDGRRGELGWLDEIPEGFCVVSDGIVAFHNETFTRMNASGTTSMVGESASEVFGASPWQDLTRNAKSNGGESMLPIEHQLGATLVESRSFRVDYRGDDAVVVISRDLSEREALRAQVSHADRLASIGTMAAGVAHEVNNPMTFLTANQSVALELLTDLRARVSEELRGEFDEIIASLEDANHGARRVKTVVSQLMMLSRSDTNDVQLCDINRLIESNVGMARAHITDHARLEIDVEDLPAIEANASLVSQVLLNLLLNAAHAVANDPKPSHVIGVKARRTERSVIIEVSDTGSGIPEAIRDQVLEPFFTTKPAGEGTGLGLATSRSIVESLGGVIDFESEVGEGTTFRVEIPFERRP